MYSLRRTIRALVVAACFLACPMSWAAGGYFVEAKGDVSIAQGKSPWRPAAKNSIVTSNTLVSTGDNSSALLRFDDGQIVSLRNNTLFNVREYRFEPKKIDQSNIVFSSIKGGFLFITGLIGKRNNKSFRLSTPNATIGVRGTEFMIAIEGESLYGKVVSGGIDMKNNAGSVEFGAGQNILVTSTTILPEPIPVEVLPAEIFSRLDSPQVPPSGIGSSANLAGVEGVDALSGILGASSLVTGSSFISSAALVAGGAIAFQSMAITAGVGNTIPAAITATIPPTSEQPAGAILASGQNNESTQANGPVIGERSLFGRHNFVPGRMGTGEICVFCHTPQGSETKVAAPLWNRTQSPTGEYKAYSSIGSATEAATGSVSIACLSCHDGTQAPNVVINSPAINEGIYFFDTETAKATRDYLKGHHPVSMLFGGGGVSNEKPDAPVDSIATFSNVDYEALAVKQVTTIAVAPRSSSTRGSAFKENRVKEEGEIKDVGLYKKQDFNQASHSGSGSGTVWWLETKGTGNGRQKADFYLYTRTDTVDGVTTNRPYVECSSCHDPHSANTTFLRIDNVGSSVCLTCHAK